MHQRDRKLSDKPNSWRIGTARADITPQVPIWLSGFASRTRPPTEQEVVASSASLFVRVLVMQERALSIDHSVSVESNSPVVVLVALDLIGAAASLTDRMFERFLVDLGLERAQVRLCFSHTHSGPVVGEHLLSLAPEDSRQLELALNYADRLIDVVVMTIGNAMKPENMERAYGRFGRGLCELAVNRREIEEKNFTGDYYGLTDHELPVMWFIRDDVTVNDAHKQEDVIGGFYGYAAHASTLTTGYEYHGDYPGQASMLLENNANLGGTWLFVAGTGGDQNIYPRGTSSACCFHAQTLVDEVLKVVLAGGQPLAGSMYVNNVFVELPFRERRSKRELVGWSEGNDMQARFTAQRLLRNFDTAGHAKNPLTDAVYPSYPVSFWAIGDVRIVFLGGEPTVEYGLRLRKEAGMDWVVGYADDVMGYVGTRAVLKEGKREGSNRAAVYYGLPSAWSSEIEGIIFDTVRNLVLLCTLVGHCRSYCPVPNYPPPRSDQFVNGVLNMSM
jgi:neutral ceramidase